MLDWSQGSVRAPFQNMHHLVRDSIATVSGLARNTRRRLAGAHEIPMPPANLRFMGESDSGFVNIGDELLRDLRAKCGLRPRSKVLDIGSGYGRFAYALLRSGEFRGSYLGFDILRRHVAWCQRNYSTLLHPSVAFVHADIRNDRYNPKGLIEPEKYSFPTGGNTHDVALAASVFTHMYPSAVLRYLSEIRRVLTPGGSALTSFFLLGVDGFTGIQDGTAYPMNHTATPFAKYAKADDPLYAFAYDWPWLRDRIAEFGFRSEEPVLGAWAGQRPNAATWQDFVVLRSP